MQDRSEPPSTPLWVYLLFGLLAVLVGVAGWNVYHRLKASVVAGRYEELTTIGQLKVDQIKAWRSERLAGASALAHWPLFAESVERWLASPADADRRAAARRYLTVTRNDIGYADVLLASRDGHILLSALGAPDSCEEPLRPAVEEALRLQHAVLTDFHTCDGALAGPYIEAVAPLTTAAGGTVGALVVRSDPSRNLYPLLRLWPSAGRTGETQLVRREGDSVLVLNELPRRGPMALRSRTPLSETRHPAVGAALGHVGRFDGVDSQGRAVLADLRPVTGSAWFIVVKMDLDEILEPWEAAVRLRLVVMALALLLAAALLRYRSHRAQVARDVNERIAAERLLRESEEYYRTLFEQSPFPMWVFDPQSLRILAVNATACRHYGYTKEEFVGLTVRDLRPPEEVTKFDQVMRDLQPTLALRFDETRHRKKDATVIDVDVASQEVLFHDRPARIVVINDVTDRRRLEQQLQQAHKMEAIGQLAGGIAHDFNNLLTVINNSADLARQEAAPSQGLQEYLDAIADAGARAARLTAQLLAFSRKQVRQTRLLDLNEVVRTIDPMLRRLLGEDIHLVTVQQEGLPSVLADGAQVEQVLVNLAVNGRDAMQGGGKLTIETSRVELDEAYARAHSEVTPGPYVVLSVTDNGCGMDAQTQARVFEPFFTTKGPGKGTGLGLSTVYGIVKQNGGHVGVYSEPGQGTTFRVYLPQANGPAAPLEAPAVSSPSGGCETILLVEDEAQVRHLARRILEQAGYVVLEAPNASKALELATSGVSPIDALITDVVMPEMSGRQLAERLHALRPQLKVLYMSGYTPNAIVHHGVLDPGIAFIGKPFTASELKRRVREVLDGVGQ